MEFVNITDKIVAVRC